MDYEDRIEEIGESFDQKIFKMIPFTNDGIGKTVDRAISRAERENCAVAFNFNGVPVIINRESNKDIVLSYYLSQHDFLLFVDEKKIDENVGVGLEILEKNVESFVSRARAVELKDSELIKEVEVKKSDLSNDSELPKESELSKDVEKSKELELNKIGNLRELELSKNNDIQKLENSGFEEEQETIEKELEIKELEKLDESDLEEIKETIDIKKRG